MRLNSNTPYATEISSNERDVKTFIGRTVFQWCTDRPGKNVTQPIASGWGLTEELLFEDNAPKEVEDDKKEMPEFPKIFKNPLKEIKGLKLSSGLQYKIMHPGCYYGAERMSDRLHLILYYVQNCDLERSWGSSAGKGRKWAV